MDLDEICDEIKLGVNNTIETIKPEAKKFFTLFNSIIDNMNSHVEVQNMTNIEKLGKINNYLTNEFNMENYTNIIEKILNNNQLSKDELKEAKKNIRKNIEILKLFETVCIDQESDD